MGRVGRKKLPCWFALATLARHSAGSWAACCRCDDSALIVTNL